MTRSEPPRHDDLAALLRGLPVREPPDLVRERVRQRALAELATSAKRAKGPLGLARFALPVSLAGTVVVYLSWAVTAAGSLYRH